MEENFYEFMISSPFWAGAGEENELSRDDFVKRFVSLTPSQKDILVSVWSASVISTICREANLTGSQIEFVAVVIREVITGRAQAADISPLLVEHLKLNSDTATTIASQLWNELLNRPEKPLETQITAPPAPVGPRPHQLNQQPASQEGDTDHIINLRDGE